MTVEFAKSLNILATVRDHLCPTLTVANYYTLPIPFLYKKEASIAVLIGRGEVVDADKSYQIWRPHLVSIFDSTTGEYVRLNEISGDSDNTEALGKGIAPLTKLTPEYLDPQIKYCLTVDGITKAMISGDSFNEKIESVTSQFSKIEPEPLLPYFQRFLK